MAAGKMGESRPVSPALARFSHVFLLNDFPPPSQSLEQASLTKLEY